MTDLQGQPHSPPPPARVMQMICGYWVTQSIHVAAELRIPDLIAAGTGKLDDLATVTGAHPGALARLLRALESLELLARQSDGRYQLTPLGECLREGVPNSMRNLALLAGEEHYRIWAHLDHSVRTGEPALERALGAPLWAYLETHPEAAVRFNNAMSDLARNVHLAAVAAYDFSTVKKVVDVGGGTGSLLAHVLATHDHLTGVLFDLPRVVAKAGPVLEQAGVQDRCEVVGGDFFAGGVPTDGDVYLMSLVLHDFDDEQSVRILKSVREAIPDHGKLVILEQVVPADGKPHISKLVDVNMLVVSGGRERTEAEFAQLLNSAGFRFEGTLPSPTTINAIVGTP